MNACSINECGKPVQARGWCAKHYKRWQVHGDPNFSNAAERGTGCINGEGYIAIHKGDRYILQHVAVAEKALGRRLPPGAQVHHVNEIKTDNRNENLVICPNQAYHSLLHLRTAAYDACGHADWRHCKICGIYDEPQKVRWNRHKECHARRERERAAQQACESLA